MCLFAALIGKFSHHRSSGVLDTKMRPAQCISKCSLPCEGNLEPQTQGQLGLAAGACSLQMGCACTVWMPAAGGRVFLKQSMHTGRWQVHQLQPQLPWPDQLGFNAITRPSFLHHHGHRLFSSLFILFHKFCASPIQQELVCDVVSVRKCHVFLVSTAL